MNHVNRSCVTLLSLLVSFTGVQTLSADAMMTIDQPQTAGISGFRAFWDTPVVLSADGKTEMGDAGDYGKAPNAAWSNETPGALAFDAVHRSMLVRFPDAADKILAELKKGQVVSKAELVLTYVDNEFWPLGYESPSGVSFIGDLWVKNPPRWHAIAYALRKPWVADAKQGPTFNAAVNGQLFWAKYGAQDETQDRYPSQLGPAEVSSVNPTGKMDITAVLNDPAYGKTPAERLRQFADNGVLVRKWETYDMHYFRGAYEWGVSTGGRGILVGTPKLEVTFASAPGDAPATGDLPAATDISQAKGGAPTAVMPSADQITQYAAKFSGKPVWMSDAQWTRVEELRKAGGGWEYPSAPDAYGKWIDRQLAVLPRNWVAWATADKLQMFEMYGSTWPAPVQDHEKLFWASWLNPEKKIADLVHPWVQSKEAQEYVAKTNDWRGNTNFYRPYSYNMGTMNFNHTAAAGALLGGHIAGSAEAEADGRHGLEHWPLRTWAWRDGSTQESVDHYYFAVTLKGQKIFADFGPTVLDRLMGQSILAKSIEELAAQWHPGLRRFVATSGRTSIKQLIITQDGLCHIMHTLSPKLGALHDIGNPNIPEKVPLIGHDAPPGIIAEQTLTGPWAPDWMSNVVEDKPLPYEMTVDYTQWGNFAGTPLYKRSYLGHHYGVASLDVSMKSETVPAMVQWRRIETPADTFDQVGTMIMRYGMNETNLIFDNANGYVGAQGATSGALQHKNKLIFLSSPVEKLVYPGGAEVPVPKELRSLQTTLGLFNYQANPTWEIYVDGQRVTQLPFTAKFSQRITIKDGPTYLAILPLGASDLGRDAEIVLKEGTPQMVGPNMGTLKPALLIESYNYKSETPMNQETADWAKVNSAYNGFVIEASDITEYPDLAAFQKHVQEAKLTTQFDEAAHLLNVDYTSGTDRLECGYNTLYDGDWNKNTPTDQCFIYRRINGAAPYLPKGINRDSTLSQQGTTGRLEKGGATLTLEPDVMGYLLTEPKSGTATAWNPLPVLTSFRLDLPEGISVQSDGKIGLLHVAIEPKSGRVVIDHAWPADTDPSKAELATALVVRGLANAPTVQFNGSPLARAPAKVTIGGAIAWVIPLGEKTIGEAELEKRLPTK